MNRAINLTHQFVEFLPDKLADGVIYVSIEYKTAAHKCFCGCGNEVNTLLSPTGWKLIFDGVSVSLHPSIGSWGFPCQSHYWIENNQVKWADRWSQSRINAGREHDVVAREIYFGSTNSSPVHTEDPVVAPGRTESPVIEKSDGSRPPRGLWQRIKGLVRRE